MPLLSNMPHRCQIRRLKRKRGELGGSFNVPVVEQTDVECWEQQASASEIRDYEQRGQKVSRKVYFPTDPGVTSQHEIIITERQGVADAAGLILTVVSSPLPDSSAGLGILFKVMCDEWTALRKVGAGQ